MLFNISDLALGQSRSWAAQLTREHRTKCLRPGRRKRPQLAVPATPSTPTDDRVERRNVGGHDLPVLPPCRHAEMTKPKMRGEVELEELDPHFAALSHRPSRAVLHVLPRTAAR
jgi:hypothetical protein